MSITSLISTLGLSSEKSDGLSSLLGGGLGGGLGGLSGLGGLGGGLGALGGGGGVGGGDWMGAIDGEAQDGIAQALHTAENSKQLSLAQALAKFMKACGDAVKASAP